MHTWTVITPCLDAERLVEASARSILAQSALRSGRARLEYLVHDGASTDGTAARLRAVCGDGASIVSERDSGMYDALAKGFRRATGDVVSYLNAGDVLFPWALDVVLDVIEQCGARWVTGITAHLNERQQVTGAILPYRYRRRLLRRGLYGSVLPFVQQESTFWERSLLETVDLARLATLRLAGDHYLWTCFARETELVVVDSLLGAFLVHAAQQSEAREAYRAEVLATSDRPSPWDYGVATIDRLLWWAPPNVKKRLNPRGLVRYSDAAAAWR